MTVRATVEAIVTRALRDGEVLAEDVNDTLSVLGFHSTESRHRMTPKVGNTLDSILEARMILDALKRNPKQAFYRYINEGKYMGATTVDYFTDQYGTRVENDTKFLCGLSALGSTK